MYRPVLKLRLLTSFFVRSPAKLLPLTLRAHAPGIESEGRWRCRVQCKNAELIEQGVLRMRQQLMHQCLRGTAVLVMCGMCASAMAEETSGVSLNVRYRYEYVNDEAFARNANAHTVRTRLGYRWAVTPNWSAFAEGDYVEGLFGEHFNSTTNGKSGFPVVADPDETELNQAYVRYSDGDLIATVGRQRVTFANLRYVANVGFRQNEQTYDALDINYRLGAGGPTLHYAWLDRAHRVFGDHNPQGEWNLDGHSLTLTQALPLGELSGYLYAIKNQSVVTASTASYGVRWTGKSELGQGRAFAWAVEGARQEDYRNNPQHVSSRYWLVEPELLVGAYKLKLGYERLGGDGQTSFQTPLATLHAFNGWADRFLVTPVDGLRDAYAAVAGKHGKLSWQAIWHDYNADRGGRNYGEELDAEVAYALSAHLSAAIAWADYNTSGFASDEQKLWLSMEYRY